jgi:ribosomal protein L11 methyltransferase
MTWRVTATGPEDIIRTSALILEEAGAPAVGAEEVERGRWRLDAYYDEEPDLDRLKSGLSEAARALTFHVERDKDNDWVRRVLEGLPAVRAGRFLVAGAHAAETARPGDRLIQLEAANAFGTGHHQSTKGCLLALDALLKRGWHPEDAVLDMGCGSGVLAIAAAKAGLGPVIAADSDAESVLTAAQNARLNLVHPSIRTVVSLGLRHPQIRARAPYGLVFANILARPLKAMAPDLVSAARPDARLILSGLLTRQAGQVTRAYTAQGCVREATLTLGPWSTLVLRKT